MAKENIITDKFKKYREEKNKMTADINQHNLIIISSYASFVYGLRLYKSVQLYYNEEDEQIAVEFFRRTETEFLIQPPLPNTNIAIRAEAFLKHFKIKHQKECSIIAYPQENIIIINLDGKKKGEK